MTETDNKLQARLNVLLVSDMTRVAGTEIATSIIARSLSRKGHQVMVAGRPGPISDALKADGISIHDVHTHSRNPLRMLLTVAQLMRLIRRHRVDIVHCQMARPVPLAWLASRLVRRPPKVFWSSRGLTERTYRRICPWFGRLGVRGVGNCKAEAEKLVRLGMPSARVSYAYNAYRLNPDEAPSDPPARPPFVIGTVADLRAHRRVDLFLQIAARLIKRMSTPPDVIFRVGGDGPERQNLQALAKELGIDQYVHFDGRLLNVAPFLSQLHAFVLPWVVEGDTGAGVSNALVEAMVMKVPACAFDASGVKEIVIDNETGRLIESGNVDAMAEALLLIMGDPREAHRLAENAHKNILSLCDPAAYAQRLATLYGEM